MNRRAGIALALACLAAGRALPQATHEVEPLTMCVVVDVTASAPAAIPLGGSDLDWDAIDRARAEVMSGLAGVLESEDRVRVGRIARTVEFSPAFVTREAVGAASRLLLPPDDERFGPSPIWDAVHEALDLLAAETGRRAVLVWADGRASGNRLSRHDVARRAAELDIPVHIVTGPTETVIRLTETTGVRIRPAVYLEWLAETSGGLFELVPRSLDERIENPLPAFVRMLDASRARDGR